MNEYSDTEHELIMGKSGKISTRKRFFWQKDDKNTPQDVELLENGQNGQAAGGAGQNDDGAGGFVPPDGGWGWVVCLTSLWANGTVFGVINSFGIIYVAMREHYAKDDPEVSLKTGNVLLNTM